MARISLYYLFIHPSSSGLTFPSLCDRAQRMNKAFMPTSPAESLHANDQNMAHCHQSGIQRGRVLAMASGIPFRYDKYKRNEKMDQ